jgi:hypothetical protein
MLQHQHTCQEKLHKIILCCSIRVLMRRCVEELLEANLTALDEKGKGICPFTYHTKLILQIYSPYLPWDEH